MKEKYREIGLTVLFLLFVAGMSTDIPSMRQKEEEPSVFAAAVKKPKKISPAPIISLTPTTIWPTWTPTPIKSRPTSQATSITQAPTTNRLTSQPSSDAAPQSVDPSPTPTLNIVEQRYPIEDSAEPQFPNDASGRGGLFDAIDQITDPLDQILPLRN